ncbi:hypothetical protein D3C85_1427530 [compost metagenome]
MGGHLGLVEQVAVLLQQGRQLVAADAAAVEHRERVAALVGEVLDQDEGEQRQALGGLVHRRGGEIRHKVVETTGVAHQLKAQGLEQGAVLVLKVRQLGIQLGITAADVVTLEQFAKDGGQLRQFTKIKMHGECSRNSRWRLCLPRAGRRSAG